MAETKALDNLPSEARAKLRKAQQPNWFAPMLATLTDERFSRKGWLFEPKLDGERCLVFRKGPDVELYSRNRKLLNSKYPELVEAFGKEKGGSFILDGEIVAFENGVTSFAKLQQRMQIQRPSAELRSGSRYRFMRSTFYFSASRICARFLCGTGKVCWRRQSSSEAPCASQSTGRPKARRNPPGTHASTVGKASSPRTARAPMHRRDRANGSNSSASTSRSS